jgi:long-subunit fatty acid transport protein
VLADFSLLLGGLHASPDITARDIDSGLTVAPFFLLGGAYRVSEIVTVGLGVFPIASAGAAYEYGPPGFEDKTSLFFIEGTPAVALNLPANVRVGLGYRITFAQLERFKGYAGSDTPFIDFTLRGMNFLGFRAGVQWTATPWLELGAVYRHKTVTTVKNDTGVAVSRTFRDVSTKLTLPSKLGAGARLDLEPFGPHASLGSDVEYGFHSQNVSAPLEGTPEAGGPRVAVANIFRWSNSITLRFGGEVRLLHSAEIDADRLALRAGYAFDGKVTNERYPSAFGTPPGPTHVLTVGTGYDGGPWQVNAAYAYRFGSGRAADVDSACAFCGVEGRDEYSIALSGIYVDAGYDF